jgi:hypothetical protein
MSKRHKPGCCVDGSCHPDRGDCMLLPVGMHCGDCTYFTKCAMLFGKKQTSDQCGWFPRKFKRPQEIEILRKHIEELEQ